MIHSGSRNFGHSIATAFCEIADRKNPVSGDLAFLPTKSGLGNRYIRAMGYALDYAKANREIMMKDALECMQKVVSCESIYELDIHHNYAALEDHFGSSVWVHRKGATSAREGEFGLIPGSMGTSSYLVKGLGNEESFCSCSHGAGRTHSRMGATRTLDQADQEKLMDGVVFDGFSIIKRGSKKVRGMTDLGEAPGAYKNIDDVMDAQKDLVKIAHQLKPLMVVKG